MPVGPTVTSEDAAPILPRGARIRLPGEDQMFVVDAAVPAAGGGMDLYLAVVSAPDQLLPRRTLSEEQLRAVRVVTEDGAASASAVLAALWSEWILCSARAAPSTALASVPLDPYPPAIRPGPCPVADLARQPPNIWSGARSMGTYESD